MTENKKSFIDHRILDIMDTKEKLKQEKILLVKIDYFKTLFAAFFAATIASGVATYLFWGQNAIALAVFFDITVAFIIVSFLLFIRYDELYRKYIDL